MPEMAEAGPTGSPPCCRSLGRPAMAPKLMPSGASQTIADEGEDSTPPTCWVPRKEGCFGRAALLRSDRSIRGIQQMSLHAHRARIVHPPKKPNKATTRRCGYWRGGVGDHARESIYWSDDRYFSKRGMAFLMLASVTVASAQSQRQQQKERVCEHRKTLEKKGTAVRIEGSESTTRM